VFWRFLMRTGHPLASRYPDYEAFESFFTRPRGSLEDYLELHTLVEKVQALENIPYFVSKLIRGAWVFEGICYLELRHTPYLRTSPELDEHSRISQMRDVVRTIAEAGRDPQYPVFMRQIICLHSRLSYDVNRAMVNLAASEPNAVCGIDLAGPDVLYAARMSEWLDLFAYAKAQGLKTTAHLFETTAGADPRLLPYLDRIGHGIQIPLRYPEFLPDLAKRRQCLEICPTTYLKTGTLSSLAALQTVFSRCREYGIDIAICTDNAGLHNVRLPFEFENLLTQDVIDFKTLQACQEAAFRHAFAWPTGRKTPHQVLAEAIAPLI